MISPADLSEAARFVLPAVGAPSIAAGSDVSSALLGVEATTGGERWRCVDEEQLADHCVRVHLTSHLVEVMPAGGARRRIPWCSAIACTATNVKE